MVQRQAASLPPHGSFNRIRSVARVYPIMVSRAHACTPKRHLDRLRALVMSPGMLRRDISRPFIIIIIIIIILKPTNTKPQAGKLG